MTNGTIINYDLSTNTIYEVLIPGIKTPGFIIPLKCKPGQFICGNHLSTTKIQWNGIDPMGYILQETFTVQASPEYAENNYLAGKASPECKFYGGTYRTQMCSNEPPTHGGLYRYSKCKGVKQLAIDFKVTGGFDWNANGDKFYFVDACNKNIREYHYHKKTGRICKSTI